MLGKLSIYLFLLLIIPDVYIYKLYITRSTGGSPFGWLWFLPSVLLVFTLVWILLSSKDALAIQSLIGTFTIAYMVIVLPKTIFMVCSLLDLPLKYLLKWQIQPFSWLGVVLGACMMIMVLYGAIWGKTRFDVKQVTFASPDLPAAFDGYRIAQISDIHTGSWNGDRAALQKAVDRINAQQTDLIVFTGDIVNTKATELEPFENILAQLKAPGWSILHSRESRLRSLPQLAYHRGRDQNIRDIQDKQAVMGWQLLNNDHVILKRAADSIALIGVENNGEPPFSQYSDLPKAMKGTEQCAFKLLLSHNPTHWRREVLDTDIDLMLAGHTHAMQFAVGRLSPSRFMYPEWSGLYMEGQTRFVCQRWIRIYRTDALAFRCMAGDHGHHAETIDNGELKIENENSVRNSKISDTFQAVGCFEGKLKLKLYVTL